MCTHCFLLQNMQSHAPVVGNLLSYTPVNFTLILTSPYEVFIYFFNLKHWRTVLILCFSGTLGLALTEHISHFISVAPMRVGSMSIHNFIPSPKLHVSLGLMLVTIILELMSLLSSKNRGICWFPDESSSCYSMLFQTLKTDTKVFRAKPTTK